MDSGTLNESNRSPASSRGSDLAIHHYQDRTQGLDACPRGFPRLELDLDKTRLRTPSATSQTSQRGSGLFRVTSDTTYTDLESATSGRSTISARKERLLRLAAERGVGITPVSDVEEMEHIQEGVESHYHIHGNISQKGDRIAGLCVGDEIADELEAEELEGEFGSDFPIPPGMQDQAGLTGLGVLGPDMFVQPFGTTPVPPKTKSTAALTRLIRRRRDSATSQASGSTTSAPSFTAIGPTPEPWAASPQVSVAPSTKTYHTKQSESSFVAQGSVSGSDKTSGRRGAFKAFLKNVSGSNPPSSKGIENIARRQDKTSSSGRTVYPAPPRPTPILKTSTFLAASRSEGNLPATLQTESRPLPPGPTEGSRRDETRTLDKRVESNVSSLSIGKNLHDPTPDRLKDGTCAPGRKSTNRR